MKYYILLLKLAIIIAALFLLEWLFYKNLVPSGVFEAAYNFKPTPFISALRPPERLTSFPTTDTAEGQRIIGDPVYFDVHLPSSFEDIEIFLLYKNPTKEKFNIAAFTDRKNWKFISREPEIKEDGDTTRGRASFSTEGLDIMNRTVTFILGAPEASIERPITITEIKIRATKKPLSLRDIPRKIFNTVKKKIISYDA